MSTTHSERDFPLATAPRLIAIGASTGGPMALKAILSRLASASLRLPVVIVQHMSPHFDESFAAWLASTSGFPVEKGASGLILQPGHAYVAPAGKQMEIQTQGMLRLVDAPPEHGACPAVDFLFRSVAQHYGPRAIGVLLTGMGRDGADELLSMRRAGALTIAQDQASSVIFGMPGEAVKLDAALHVLPPPAIAALLIRLAGDPSPLRAAQQKPLKK